MAKGRAGGPYTDLAPQSVVRHPFDEQDGTAQEGDTAIINLQGADAVITPDDALSDPLGDGGNEPTPPLTAETVNAIRFVGGDNRALDFDGVDGKITASSAGFSTTAISVSFWFKHTITSWRSILSTASSGSWADGIAFIQDVNNKLRFWVDDYATNLASSDVAINDGSWHHAAGVWDGATIKLYIDGVLQSATDTFTGTVSHSNMIFGTDASVTAGQLYDGNIKDVAVLSDALTQQEITNLADPSQAPTTLLDDPNRVAHWPLEETPEQVAAGTAFDILGNYPGTITGGVTSVTGAPYTLNSKYYMELPDYSDRQITESTAALPFDQVSLSTWLAPEQIDRRGIYSTASDESQTNGYGLQTDAEGKLNFFVGDVTQAAVSNAPLVPSQTYQAVGTWDGATATLYLDGVAQDVTAAVASYRQLAGTSVAWFKLDETSGLTAVNEKGPDGSYEGGLDPAVDSVDAPMDGLVSAIRFDGLDDYVDGGLLTIGISDLTVSCWAKTTDTPTIAGMVGRPSSAGYRYGLLMTDGNPGKLRAQFNGGDGTKIAASTTDINDGNWHHCLATYNRDGDMTVYVDGVSEGAVDISGGSFIIDHYVLKRAHRTALGS